MKSSGITSPKMPKGMTLVEVMVTMLIFTLGLLGVAGMQIESLKGSQDAAQRSQAIFIANEIADRMRSNEEALIAQTYDGITVNCNDNTTQCASHALGGSLPSDGCTAQQMATFDIWEASCGYDNQNGEQASSAVDGMVLESVSIECTDNTCANYNLNVSFYGQSTGDESRSVSFLVTP